MGGRIKRNSYYRFVRSVRAVNKAIAFPLVGNTDIITAIEIIVWWTRVFRAVVTFIGIIATVILSVAEPPFLDASTVGASEFIRRAIDICKTGISYQFKCEISWNVFFLFILFI